MTFQEKSLYHQIHPLKLFIDWSMAIIVLYPFWRHDMLMGFLIAFIPSIHISLVLTRFTDLNKYKLSAFGKYVRQYMTYTVETIRFAGYALMIAGAWYHLSWLIPVGLLVILLTWLRGIIFPKRIKQSDFISIGCSAFGYLSPTSWK